MARYKTIDTSPRFLAVDLRQQLIAGTFEHALDWLVDHELDLRGFDARYRNDDNGAPAYPPALLLKIVLFAYSRGMVSSRHIERATKMETAVKSMLTCHQAEDAKPEPAIEAKAAKRIERLNRDARQIREWLEANPQERKGAKGAIRKSNLTDNESAKMATAKGVIQGYCGVAAVDARHPVIVEAQAHGTGSEQSLLVPVVEAISPLLFKVAFFPKNQASPLPYTQRMKTRIDSAEGKRLYGQRFATVEPVFGNIRHNKQLNRFTLRGQTKVDAQWKLYCLVHNIEKLANHGFAMPNGAARSAA